MSKAICLYLQQFLSSLSLRRCGHSANKLVSIALTIVLMCGFTLPSYAADGSDTIKASDMELKAEYYTQPNSDGIDCTNQVTTGIYKNSSPLDGMYYLRFPLSLKDTAVAVAFFEPFSINANHEYNLSFDWGYTSSSSFPWLMVFLNYIDSNGNILKQQMLADSIQAKAYTKHSVDVDFKPDVSGLDSGYKCQLVIEFAQNSSTTASECFLLSQEISLTDKDDNSGWFAKIIAKIQETIDGIKQIPQKINEKLTELKESIVNAFIELKDNLVEGLKGLFVPSDDFFEEKKAELEVFLEDHFGILWTAPNIIISTIQQLLTMSPKEPSITMPAIQFMWDNELVTLTEPMTVHFSDYIGDGAPLKTLYNFYRVFVTIVLIFLFINYCLKKYHYIFGKDGEAV